MIEINEKLKVFTSYLQQEQQTSRKMVLENAQKKCEALESAALQKIEIEKKNINLRAKKVLERDRSRMIGEGRQEANDSFLCLYKDLTDDFIDMLLRNCRNLIDEPSYQTYLKGCVQKLPEIFNNEKGLSLYINEEDAEVIKAELKNLPGNVKVTIHPLSEKERGGFVAEDSNRRIHYDCTLRNLVRVNEKLIGQHLQDLLENREENRDDR
ncbi:MAG: hypothetical protein GX127_09565 [Eubacteriaceae bacterium]|jgi:vacuolar-type H+-ATPase subunit E/Vma4|nr:hypothetical protein [Eubacteriaceae bacterium]